MPHAQGSTLATIKVAFVDEQVGSEYLNILHADMGVFPSTPQAADQTATALALTYAAGIAPLIYAGLIQTTIRVSLDDGVSVWEGSHLNNTHGTLAGDPLPSVMCAIIRKVAGGTGRSRFGHLCHPGITGPACSDENNLTAAYLGNLIDFYQFLTDGAGPLGLVNAKFVLYNAAQDLSRNIQLVFGDTPLRTQRRRTPGRGA